MKIISIFILYVLLNGCSLSVLDAGTHGSLGGYSYNISKEKLEDAISEVIINSNNINQLETDGGEYTSIIIRIDRQEYFYVFRFFGDQDYFITHPSNSKIFVTAAKIDKGEYKSYREIGKSERINLMKIFETEFINKINKAVGCNGISDK